MENWLLIMVTAIFLIGMVVGIIRGGIRIVVSLVATALTLVLVVMATPYVSSFLYKATPIKDMVQSECETLLLKSAKDKLTAEIADQISATTGINFGNAQIGNGDFDWAAFGVKEKDILEVLEKVEFPREVQISVIESSGLPQFMKDKLLENNNNEVYKSLGVGSFVSYIGAYLAKLITDIIAFLLTFLLVTLVVRITMYALNIMGELPVLYGLNRVAGGILGLATGLLLVWVFFAGITLAYQTALGKECFTMIESNQFLSFLYENNPILQWVTKLW